MLAVVNKKKGANIYCFCLRGMWVSIQVVCAMTRKFATGFPVTVSWDPLWCTLPQSLMLLIEAPSRSRIAAQSSSVVDLKLKCMHAHAFLSSININPLTLHEV